MCNIFTYRLLRFSLLLQHKTITIKQRYLRESGCVSFIKAPKNFKNHFRNTRVVTVNLLGISHNRLLKKEEKKGKLLVCTSTYNHGMGNSKHIIIKSKHTHILRNLLEKTCNSRSTLGV